METSVQQAHLPDHTAPYSHSFILTQIHILISNMRVTFLFVAAASAASATVSVSVSDMTDTTLLSTAPPAGTTSGPSYCTASDLSQYSSLPKLTGSLLDEFYSFHSELQQDCTATESGIGAQSCSVLESSYWCSFSTAVPSTLLSDYSSYASSAEAKRQADADRTTMTTTTMAAGTPGATTGQTITVPSRSGSTTGGPKATKATAKPNGALGHRGMTGIWMVVSMGMATALVNMMA
ncbi:hypothetical protein TRV_02073 [Trichophyton verrucosum HKI 0517]|uniref:DUF7735 domain-containing protein n=1 Tax=Trichophyton verrucosum (strain HKI 0517) TaxID=663202 RepID=D4D4Q7_TRIVH|nr:uncharacterized protein TRV_02073 [Trichophyton verrucosum HKI 0517]EFE43166.1 hypothetical protein TRV_02073 [Trichophyton verrucosum HKI 0517]